jgi:hypothetical protein
MKSARWVIVILAVTTVLMGAGRAHGVTVTSVDKLTVFDAKNRIVGTALGAPERPTVALRLDERLAAVLVVKQGLSGTGGLYFEATGCTGPGLMRADPIAFSGLIDPIAVGPPGATVYRADRSVPARTISAGSYLIGAFPAPHTCFSTDSANVVIVDVVPAGPIVDLTAHFTPPFSLEPVPLAAGAPALSEWAQIIAVGFVLATGIWFLRRRRPTATT